MEKDILQLKLDMGEVKSDMKHVKKEQADLKNDMKQGFKSVMDKIDGLDKKFSAKWVEKIVIWIARIVGLAILGGLVTVIWKAAIFFIG